jgi:murein DD-endopeptidase MepM/ murein hydrolase activator NlpD
MGKFLVIIAVASAIVIGIVLNSNARTENAGMFEMKKLTPDEPEKSGGTDSNFRLLPETSEAVAKTGSDDEKVDMSLINTSGDEPEEDDDDVVYEIPDDLPVQGSTANQSVATRCVEVAKVYQTIAKKFNFTTPAAEVCALGNQENGGKPICLGSTRGEPCETSKAGAEGSFQVKRKTALSAWKTLGQPNGTYSPQNLEDNMAVAIHFLEQMKEQHKEDRFRAYNGGAAIDKASGLKNYDKPGPVRIKTTNYDRGVRRYIPIFQAVLDGKVDTGAIGGTTQVTAISTPLPEDTGPITAGLGEPRPYRNGTHHGFDLHAKVGVPVKAIRGGCKVIATGWNKDKGMKSPGFYAGVKVILNCGNGTPMTLGSIRYFHLTSVAPNIVVGYKPQVGEVLGYTGDTGGANGKVGVPHLHFETHIWSTGGKMIPDNPSKWTDMSAFSPVSSLYKGPRDDAWRAAKKKFLAMDQKH